MDYYDDTPLARAGNDAFLIMPKFNLITFISKLMISVHYCINVFLTKKFIKCKYAWIGFFFLCDNNLAVAALYAFSAMEKIRSSSSYRAVAFLCVCDLYFKGEICYEPRFLRTMEVLSMSLQDHVQFIIVHFLLYKKTEFKWNLFHFH